MDYLHQNEYRWYLSQQTFPELLERNVMCFTSKIAQMWKSDDKRVHSITYGELGRIVKEITCGLMTLGIQPGDRVAIMSNTRQEWLWCDYAILCAAGITVCVYPSLSENEVNFILNDSGSRIIFAENETVRAGVEKIAGSCSSLEKIIQMSGDPSGAGEGVMTLDAIRQLGVKALVKDRLMFDNRWRTVKMTDRMTIVYTSGTTGNPKGAVHTHLSVNAAVLRDLSFAPFIRDDYVMLSFLPLSHTYERECGQGIAMQTATPIAYSSPQTLVDDFMTFRPHFFMSVPRIYERIYMALKARASQSAVTKMIFNRAMKTGLKVVERISDENGFVDVYPGMDLTAGVDFFLRLRYKLYDRLIFSKVRSMLGGNFVFACSAAGSLSPELFKVFLAMGLNIFEGYGSTETCNTINMNRIHRVLPGHVGPPATGVEGRIAEDGEWTVRGNNLFLEYWNNPQATSEVFTDDGFYKTGDIVEIGPEGFVKIVDRKKGLIVLDTGKNIASSKVEQSFSTSPYIDVAFPVGDSRKFIGALVVPNFEEFINLFEQKGIAYDESAVSYYELNGVRICERVGRDFIENPLLKEIIDHEIEKANRGLESYERIKKYAILEKRFTEHSGEMTPTLKVKRKVVAANFKREIDGLYE